jgi:hypothetical protein
VPVTPRICPRPTEAWHFAYFTVVSFVYLTTNQVDQKVTGLRERDYWEGLEEDGGKTLKTGISGLD